MNDEQISILNNKIDVIIGLLTLNFTKDKTLKDRVELLDSLGLKEGQIAKCLGKSKGNISKNLDRIRKEKKKNSDED